MTKEQQRNELHKTIWSIADDLRGAVDGWDFKQYVLGFLFYHFISENIEQYINEKEEKRFNYADISDQEAEKARQLMLDEKGFFILPSELFCNVWKNAKNNKNLNVTIHNVFKNIEKSAVGHKSEESLKGLFDDLDVNSNKLGATVDERNEKLRKLLDAIGNMQLGNYHDNSIDVFGDAYEFLMTMYASKAGKSGGEFFTPQEVSELLAKITVVDKNEVNKVYDPCCGSGSLLLKYAKILGKDKVKTGFFGQELNITTYNLCRINMFLHNINYNDFNIKQGDTLKQPKHLDEEPFDAIVSNPPYSIKWEGDENTLNIDDPRFSPAGVLAPNSKADLAFTMHMLHALSPKGTCAIVEFPGILYRGGKEQKIRKYLVDNNFVDCIIQLPNDLFFGPTISTIILVLKKNKKDNNVLFIDASNEFVRVDAKNKLTEDNINHILEAYKQRKDKEYFAKIVSYNEIKDKEYNLSVNQYLKPKETKQQINIVELNMNIKEIVKKQSSLRKSLDEIIDSLESDGK